MFTRVRQAYYFIRDSLQWLKFFWQNGFQDYDYTHIYRVLRYQLQRTHDQIELEQRHLCYKKKLAQIRLSITVIDRYLDKQYFHEYLEANWIATHGPIPDWRWEDMPNGCHKLLSYYDDPELEKSYRKTASAAMDYEHRMQRQDLQFLSDMLIHHSASWWT